MKHKFWAIALSGAIALCVGLSGCGNTTDTFEGLQYAAEGLIGSRVTQEQLAAAAEELTKDDAQYTVKTAYTVKNPISDKGGKVVFYFQNDIYTVHIVDGAKQHITQVYRTTLDLLGKKTFEITDYITDYYDFIFSHSIPSGTYTDETLTEAWTNAWNEYLHEEWQKDLKEINQGSMEKYRINVEEGSFGQAYLAWDLYVEDVAGKSYCYWNCYDGSCVKQRGKVSTQSATYLYNSGWFTKDCLKRWDVETLPASEEYLGWKAEHLNADLKDFFASAEFESFRTRAAGSSSKTMAYSNYDEGMNGYMGYLANGEFYGILKFDRNGKAAAWYYPESFVPWDDLSRYSTPAYFHTVIEYNETKVTLPTVFVSEEE